MMTGVILSGGRHKRFPYNKAFIEIDGDITLYKNIAILREIFPYVSISANRPWEYFQAGCPMIGDLYPDKGPIGGIFSILMNITTERAFIMACDMPFVMPAMIRYLTSLQTDSDAVIPLFDSTPQPLFAVYHRRLIPRLEGLIKRGRYKLRDMLSEISVLYVEESSFHTIDGNGVSFININTPMDLENVRMNK